MRSMALKRIKNLGPVKRYRSERYVLISLVTFALTVVALRGILELTGYAQIGNDTVHIAHVLWGGLALFAAALLLLAISNRWALGLGAVLSGGGVGLFIDEVGKFITQSNNYFTPAAAPIIYALFLATVLVYLRVRRPPGRDVRGEMYRALEQMSGVLDHEMSRHDLNELARRLEQIQASAKGEAVRVLAASMLAFVEAERPRIVESTPSSTWLCWLFWQSHPPRGPRSSYALWSLPANWPRWETRSGSRCAPCWKGEWALPCWPVRS
jgi:hypothetical protein